MRYEVNEGRVATWALETHVVDGCNLRCASCCTRSPELTAEGGERFVDVEALGEQLEKARRVLAPQVFKLTGGEPMLHPRLAELVAVAKESGVAKVVSVTTNGLLAARMEDAFWRGLDRLTLSVYASAPVPERTRELVRDRCATWGVKLVVKEVSAFQRMDRAVPSTEDEARATFARCWLRHRCHMLWAGRFFACTRPPHLEQLGVRVHEGPEADDGCELELRALLAYLEREAPLASCAHCFGGEGAWEPHRQLDREELAVLRVRRRAGRAPA